MVMTGARAIVGRPGFYKCRTCAYWHPAGQVCRPTHNGFTVGVLDAMHPDHDGDHFADWRAVKAPPQRRTHAQRPRR